MLPGPDDIDPFADPGTDDDGPAPWPEPVTPPPASDPFLHAQEDDEDGTTAWPEPIATEAGALPVVDDTPPRDDPFDDLGPEEPRAIERVELPWQTRAVVVQQGRTVAVRLDPGAADSRWVGGPPDLDGTPVLLYLGELNVKVRLDVAPGDDECIVLGRDALADRIAVTC